MTTITSSSNKPHKTSFGSQYWSVLSRYIGLEIAMLLVSFIFFALPYMTEMSSAFKNGRLPHFYGVSQIYTEVSIIVFIGMMLILPIFLASSLYNYMHNKQAVDFYHSMPVTRERLLLVNITAAMTIIMIPVIVNILIIVIAGAVGGVTLYMGAILTEIAIWFVVSLAIFLIATLIAVNVGTSLETILFSIAAVALATIVLGVGGLFCQGFLNGFAMPDGELFMSLTPVGMILLRFMTRGDIQEYSEVARDITATSIQWMIAWLLISIVLYVLCIFIYKRRKSELASQAGVRNIVTIIIKFFTGAYCLGMLIAVMFDLMITGGESNQVAISVGLIIGGALGYFLIESITAKGFATFKKSLPILGVSAAFMLIFGLCIFGGGFGYENRIPQPSKVESVTINYRGRYSEIRHRYNVEDKQSNMYGNYEDTVTLTGEKAKELVTQIHKQTLDFEKERDNQGWNTTQAEDYSSRISNLRIEYKTSTGALKRFYYNIPQGVDGLLTELETEQEFKKQVHPVHKITSEHIREVQLSDIAQMNTTALKLTADEKAVLLDCLQADMLAETTQQLALYDQKDLGYIQLTLDTLPKDTYTYDTCYVLIRPYYEKTIAFLTQKNAMNAFTLDGSKVKTISVSRTYGGYYGRYSEYIFLPDFGMYEKAYDSDSEAYITTNPEEIAQMLQSLSGYTTPFTSEFSLAATLYVEEDGRTLTVPFSYEKLPPKAQQHFKNMIGQEFQPDIQTNTQVELRQ